MSETLLQELAACRRSVAESRELVIQLPRVFDVNMRPMGDPDMIRAQLFDVIKRLRKMEGEAAKVETERACWHCYDVLEAVRGRCEQCPEECDDEGCDQPGCEDRVDEEKLGE